MPSPPGSAADPQPGHTNRLIHETSPYLLQHAHNPVDWYPWGPEALEKAKAEKKPLLLSIGYSACHWCHVMERESFEDEAIAALMNKYFVNVKVDREERPDLDSIYMAATQALNRGQGGWPMTLFLTPDMEPFFGGTYFPPDDRYGRPGFPTLLEHLGRLWAEDPDHLRERASRLTDHLRAASRPPAPLALGETRLKEALEYFRRNFDPLHGGFGGAPKFPPAMGLSLLLRLHHRTGEADILEMVQRTLDAMARGGIYDQIGGGFCRYATDERWLVPHFEKMLYDNALLVPAYLSAYQVTGRELYRQVAAETLDYLLAEMVSPEGGFYASTDADSEGVEGKFFVWTPAQIKAILGSEAGRRFCAYYDISPGGNWEGKSIPNVPLPLKEVAATLKIGPAQLKATLAAAKPQVYAARLQRVAPALDDKVICGWNGLALSALASGYRVLGEPRYLAAAEKTAAFLLAKLRTPHGRLLRTYRAGQAKLSGYLEDYAYLAQGLMDLYEAGGAARWLTTALDLAKTLLRDFLDDDSGAFYSTARDHEQLLLRPLEGSDGATPAANGVAALVLARLSHHFDEPELRQAAERALTAYGEQIAQAPGGFAQSLTVVDYLLAGPVEVALVGTPGEPGYEALRSELGRHYLPNQILAHYDPACGDPPALPLLEGKGLVQGRAGLYLCAAYACKEPVTDPGEVGQALKTHNQADSL